MPNRQNTSERIGPDAISTYASSCHFIVEVYIRAIVYVILRFGAGEIAARSTRWSRSPMSVAAGTRRRPWNAICARSGWRSRTSRRAITAMPDGARAARPIFACWWWPTALPGAAGSSASAWCMPRPATCCASGFTPSRSPRWRRASRSRSAERADAVCAASAAESAPGRYSPVGFSLPLARSMPSRISWCALSGPSQPSTLTHLLGSRSL